MIWNAKPDYLGEFELVFMLALLHLGDRGYGVSVRQEIAARTSRDVSIGAIYTTLSRLEDNGYVLSRAMCAPSGRAGPMDVHDTRDGEDLYRVLRDEVILRCIIIETTTVYHAAGSSA